MRCWTEFSSNEYKENRRLFGTLSLQRGLTDECPTCKEYVVLVETIETRKKKKWTPKAYKENWNDKQSFLDPIVTS